MPICLNGDKLDLLFLVRVMALEIIKLYLPVNRTGSLNLKDDNTIAKSPLSRRV